MMRLACCIIMGLLATAALCGEESPAKQHWNLGEVCRMESADYWTGPWPISSITVDGNAAEGDGCLKVPVSIEPGHRLRIERGFTADCHDGFQNMMGMGMVDEDFTGYRAISFSYKTDVVEVDHLVFRLWDREGGWLEWRIPQSGKVKQWQKVTLSVPPRPTPMLNSCRVGGVLFEIKADAQPTQGNLWLDDLRFLTDSTEGVSITPHAVPSLDYNCGINAMPVKDKYEAPPIHLVMNMSGEIGLAMYKNDADLAIKRLSDAISVFKDIDGLEFFFGHETPGKMDIDDPKLADWRAKSRETHVKMARWCEENKIPFYVQVGIGAQGPITVPPNTVAAVLQAAPVYCRGVVMGEFSIDTNNLVDQTGQIMQLLQPVGKKCLYFQQSSYWFGVMQSHGNKMMDVVMASKYKDTFVPMWENLLPSAPALCLAGASGLYRSGKTSAWGVSAQGWGYANMNWGGTSDQPGDLWLRMFLSVACLGGTYIEIEPKWAFDGENVPGQVEHFKQWAHNLRWVGRRRAQVDIDLDPSGPMKALRLFDKLVKAGVVLPPAGPDRVLSFSPVSFQSKQGDAFGDWGLFRVATDNRFWDGCCPNSYDMATQVPGNEAFSYLYGSNHFYDQTLPEMPYGLISAIPGQVSVPAEVKTVLPTNGKDLFWDGKRIGPNEAKPIVLQVFKTAAMTMPFRVADCTWSATAVGKGDYLITVVDPEERFPVGVKTRIEVRLSGPWKAFDAVTSQELTHAAESIPVDVEPAGFRLIRVVFQGG